MSVLPPNVVWIMFSNLLTHKTNWRTLILLPCACGLKCSHLCNFRLYLCAKNCYLLTFVLGPLWRNIICASASEHFAVSVRVSPPVWSLIAGSRREGFEGGTLGNTCFLVTPSGNFISTFFFSPSFFNTAKFHVWLEVPLLCFIALTRIFLFHLLWLISNSSNSPFPWGVSHTQVTNKITVFSYPGN